MSWWRRAANVARGARAEREIREEQEAHLAEAVAHGCDPEEARRAFGSMLRQAEKSRDIRLVPWLDALRADAVFGWRQLAKNKVTSAAAILSLALAMGACIGAFRLIDALLLRPLPIAGPERLYDLYRDQIGWDGKPGTFDGWAHPVFRQMRAAARGEAELIAISYAEHMDLAYGSGREIEKAYVQYVSGWMFGAFGLRPAAGRLLTEGDDREPGAHPYAVLSYSYWSNRFAKDAGVVGRTFQMGERIYEIVGVTAGPFTGTEPGTVVDLFLPAMMHPAVTRSDSTWHRALAVMKEGVAVEPLRQKLNGISLAFERERAKGFTNVSPQNLAHYLHQTVEIKPAPGGVSGLQAGNRRALIALAAMAGLVLLIACANVANLTTAQAAARGREMALRVSIGAGRGRLVQLVLVESTLLALAASMAGALFAWQAVPVVVSMIGSSSEAVRLALPADWRVTGFSIALTLAVVMLFGLAPAWRASAVRPASALRGGDDPESRRRLMRALIAAQVAFCLLVLFVAGLFGRSFARLARVPTGFSADRVLTLDTVAARPQEPIVWMQVVDHLRTVPGVEAAGLAGWPLLSGNGWNNSVAVRGGGPSDDLTYFLSVSPGWLDVMKIPLIAGRDFRGGDRYPATAIVNETFARRFFSGENPVGQAFDETQDEGGRRTMRIVGVVRDARYRGMREPIPPVAYVPFDAARQGTIVVRTSGANPLAMAGILRREVPRARSELRVSNIRTQQEINDALTVRERLLAVLALFFAAVALLLAGVGLYGVLDYSVLQRRREIGIRMAIGAQAGAIARSVIAEIVLMVLLGTAVGLALGTASVRFVEALLYGVSPADWSALAPPAMLMAAAGAVAALPAVLRAVRIDPAQVLRAE